MTDILAGNTNPSVNPFWGKFAIDGPDGRRPATLKTGTNNDAKDLNAYGYIAPPTDGGRDAGAYALAVGRLERQQRQHPGLDARAPLFSIDVSTFVWQGFLHEATAKWPVTNFQQPADGLVQVKIDPFTGLKATSGAERSTSGSSPAPSRRTRSAPTPAASTSSLEVNVESGFDNWMTADRDWIRRAERGPGVVGGPDEPRTAYFYNGAFRPYGASWGALVGGQLRRAEPGAVVLRRPDPGPAGVVPSFAVPSPDRVRRRPPLPCPPRRARAVADRAVARTDARHRPSRHRPEPPPTPTPEPTRRPRSRPKPTPTPDVTPPPPPAEPPRRPEPVTDARPSSSRSAASMVRRAGRTILGPLDWTIRAGERWVVLGPNGSGKTTLLSVVGLELWPTAGTVDGPRRALRRQSTRASSASGSAPPAARSRARCATT